MTWARPVGIGFLMLAVLAFIGIRVEVGSDSTSWVVITVWAVLGALGALVGIGLIVAAQRADDR